MPEVGQVPNNGAGRPERSSCIVSHIPEAGFQIAKHCRFKGCTIFYLGDCTDRGCGEQIAHVLDGDKLGAEPADRFGHVRPGPAQIGDITEIRGVRPVVGENVPDWTDLGEADRLRPEDVFDGEVEAAGTRNIDPARSGAGPECSAGSSRKGTP